MNDATKKIQEYGSLHPFDFDMVGRLELVVTPLIQGYTTQLTLRCISSRGERKAQVLVLNFEEVRDLKFRAPGAPFQTFLDVRDVSDRQWDRVKYQVLDNENAMISFFCNDFSFRIEGSI